MEDEILDIMKAHLRDAGVRYGSDKRLKKWLEELAHESSELVFVDAPLSKRMLDSIGRQALLITEYVRVQEAKAFAETFRAVLITAIRIVWKLM